jgi:C-terminal processing protease CtpA/Prc
LRNETTDALKVLPVISGSPAFRMRVQPDDLIEAIDRSHRLGKGL